MCAPSLVRLVQLKESENEGSGGGGGGGSSKKLRSLPFDMGWYWGQVIQTLRRSLGVGEGASRNPFLAVTSFWIIGELRKCVPEKELVPVARAAHSALDVGTLVPVRSPESNQ